MMKADVILSSIRWLDVEGETQVPIEAKRMIKGSNETVFLVRVNEDLLIVEISGCM
jgi:hypothetical protein